MPETINRVAGIIRLHQQIAIDLCDDRSRADRDTSRVSFDQRDLGHVDLVDGHRIEEENVGPEGEIGDRFGHGELAGAEDVDAVDRLRLDHADRDGAGAAEDEVADGEAVLRRHLLGVVDAEEGGVGIEDHAGGDDRTGQAAPADLVRAGDGPETEIAEPALDR
jgi:hypothetical protein